MEYAEGKIKQKTQKEGRSQKGEWIRTSYLLDDGRTYSTFEKDQAGFNEDDLVKVGFKKNGDFNNIQEIFLLDDGRGRKKVNGSGIVEVAFLGLCKLYSGSPDGFDVVKAKLPEAVTALEGFGGKN